MTVIARIYLSYSWGTDLANYDANITLVQTGPTHDVHGTK